MLLLSLLPAAADAATRKVPFGFWGANYDGLIIVRASAGTRAQTWAKMADSGVESTRTSFFWSHAEFYKGQLDFSTTDDLVAIATANNIKLLPVVMGAPRWARQSDEPASPPTKEGRAAYANYVRQLIRHYGPNGVFWNTHPWLPKKPIREWQMWNEPSEKYPWTIPDGQDYAPGYGALLRAAYKAAHAEDPGAKVVLAGLPNYSWNHLEHLYKKGGIKGYFDRAAVHPYTMAKHGVRTIVGYFRDVLKKHGAGGMPIFVTETGLPASKGKTKQSHVLETTDAGMAAFLKETYTDLMASRKSLGIGRVYWYTWASSYANWYFNYTGLFKYQHDFNNHRDVLTAKPAFSNYRALALAAEGK